MNPESVYWRYFLAQRAKATPTSFGNLVANLVPNLVDCNTLNTNLFYSKTWFLDVFSGTGTISFTEKTQPEYLFRTLLPQCVSIMARLP